MSNLVDYAKRELSLIGDDECGMQKMMNDNIIEIIKIFSDQNHSGFSANYLINTIERLMRFKPLKPLTGHDDEWNKCGEGMFQNKRCSSVFKKADGICEDIDAIIVSDDGGITWFSSPLFSKEVEFPYIPSTNPEKIYIEYKVDPALGFVGDEYDIITDNPERIKLLYERKRREME